MLSKAQYLKINNMIDNEIWGNDSEATVHKLRQWETGRTGEILWRTIKTHLLRFGGRTFLFLRRIVFPILLLILFLFCSKGTLTRSGAWWRATVAEWVRDQVIEAGEERKLSENSFSLGSTETDGGSVGRGCMFQQTSQTLIWVRVC